MSGYQVTGYSLQLVRGNENGIQHEGLGRFVVGADGLGTTSDRVYYCSSVSGHCQQLGSSWVWSAKVGIDFLLRCS